MSLCPRASKPKMTRKPHADHPIRRAAERCILEHLETRQLLSATVTAPFTGVSGEPGTTSSAIDLSTHFDDPT